MTKQPKILIIGGVAGGASCATRARRLSETAEIIIFERGPHISFANCGLPYYISGDITEHDRLLLQTPKKILQRYNIEVRINSEVIKIDRANKTLHITDHTNQTNYTETYDVLVLSPGAKPIVPPLPGIHSPGIFVLRNIADMDAIDHWIKSQPAKTAVVIGGGYIGLEMAEALHKRKLEVTIVELAPQVMSPIDPEMASLLHQELLAQGVKLELNSAAQEFTQQNNKLAIKLSTNKTLSADLVLLAIGVKPEVQLATAAGLKIGELGGIAVAPNLQTSDPNIYAIGDAIEITEFVSQAKALIPLAGPANRQGRIAADNIFGRNTNYTDTQGTGICKVFNLTAGMTGLNEKYLSRQNYHYEKIYLHANDHAEYYPNASLIHLKVLFNPTDGTIYGAQAVGVKGIDKRIDVIATAIRARQPIYALTNAELSYAPPYGAAKDILNYAGFVASNLQCGDIRICHPADIIKTETKIYLLDVRTPEEVACGTIPGATNIPIDELRSRLNELPKDQEIIVFCKVGIRGYLACRILMQHGFNCRNLSGGYQTYLMATNTLPITGTRNLAPNNQAIAESSAIIDARGMQCPGPIQKLKTAIDNSNNAATISVLATDQGFVADATAWCQATGNTLIAAETKDNYYQVTIRKGSAAHTAIPSTSDKKLTIVVFNDDLDKALAAFIIANGAIAMGIKPTLFFTFWGINILRQNTAPKVKKTLLERLFSYLLPNGPKKLALSKMNMGGLGTALIKHIMKNKNVASLPELMQSAIDAKVKLVACNMSMDLMGIKRSELIENVEIGGVATYLENASGSGINLFL